jgi:hypothetical protein
LSESIVDELTMFRENVFLDEFSRREQLVALFAAELAFLLVLDVGRTQAENGSAEGNRLCMSNSQRTTENKKGNSLFS